MTVSTTDTRPRPPIPSPSSHPSLQHIPIRSDEPVPRPEPLDDVPLSAPPPSPDHHAAGVPAATTITTVSTTPNQPFIRPPFFPTLKRNPRQTLYTIGLFFVLSGSIAGWAVFLHVRKTTAKTSQNGNDQGDKDDDSNSDNGMSMSAEEIIPDAGFLLVILFSSVLLLRQIYYMVHLYLPPRLTTNSSNHSSRSQINGSSFLPPWLLPRLPTYIDAVGGRGQTTGDVEDRWIVGEALPLYGNTRGSKLLLRSQSRGGAPPSIRDSVVSVEEGGRERPVSYGQSQAQTWGSQSRTGQQGLSADEEALQRAREADRLAHQNQDQEQHHKESKIVTQKESKVYEKSEYHRDSQ